ncbi:MAG: hypothetical protein ING08_08160 [Roseomonas sp.]|nr:hypothetical protein [Roseomonas sp.]
MSDIVERLQECWNSIDPKAREAALAGASQIKLLRDQLAAFKAERDAIWKNYLKETVPPGFVVVPRLATEAMRAAGLKQFQEFEYPTPSGIWTAMVEAGSKGNE